MSKNAVIGTIVFVIVGVAAVAGGFYLWQSNQQLSEENTQLAADKASLRRQLQEAQAIPTPTPTPTATPTPLAAVTLKEFSVKYVPTPNIADVTGVYAASTKTVGFGSASLAAKGGACAASGTLGVLSRQAKGTAAPAGATKTATVGAYDYYYVPAATSCSTDTTVAALQTSQAEDLKAALAGLQ